MEDLLTVGDIDRLKEENEFICRTDEKIYQEAEDNIGANIVSFWISCNWREDAMHRKAMEEFVERLKEKALSH